MDLPPLLADGLIPVPTEAIGDPLPSESYLCTNKEIKITYEDMNREKKRAS